MRPLCLFCICEFYRMFLRFVFLVSRVSVAVWGYFIFLQFLIENGKNVGINVYLCNLR